MPGKHHKGWATIVCAASGPSFTAEDAELVERAQTAGVCRVLAVNTTGLRRLPNADALYAADRAWWIKYRDEIRARWGGGELWTHDAKSAAEFVLNRVKLGKKAGLSKDWNEVNNGGNSGYQAIGLAYLFGAKKIILVGYDMQRTGGLTHHFGDHEGTLHNAGDAAFKEWAPRFAPLAADLEAAGIDVVNCTKETAITAFRRADLAATLGKLMRDGVTSIIIPCFNRADCVREAIESALAQTAPVEVVVVDDGSAEPLVLEVADPRVRLHRIAHAGPGAARNAGIDLARGEFVNFLDADDTIEPDKVARQLAGMTPEVGFVLCDVRITGPGEGVEQLASDRYDYKAKGLGGWIAPLLAPANFIPIMSPLVRASALAGVRFPVDLYPEDWPFWRELATVARCRYIPDVLATYRKRAGSRNAGRPADELMAPLRLNLGCGNPAERSWHPVPGFANLDKALGWRFEDGLGDYADRSVSGITISHALMYVREGNLDAFFAECARVLEPGGVVRITEDDTVSPASTRRGGWRGSHPAVTLTSPEMMRRYLSAAGFVVHNEAADTTHYRDRSLCQVHHGPTPHVFFMEGVRECGVLFTPHSDDEALFAAFTIIEHRPRVVICFGSSADYGHTEVRTRESVAACKILGSRVVEQWNGGDLAGQMRKLDACLHPTHVWAPCVHASHPDHRAVALAAALVFGELGDRLQYFQTYDNGGKVRDGEAVPFRAEWVGLKRAALACYRSQLEHPRAREFFAWDLAEYRA